MSLEQLIKRYPRLFRGESPPCSSWAPAGWMRPLTELFDRIDGLLDDELAARFKVFQIKEKFATLRVYWSLDGKQANTVDFMGAGGHVGRLELGPENPDRLYEQIRAWVKEAEAQSGQLCEACGAPSHVQVRAGWMTTLCPSCLEKQERARR